MNAIIRKHYPASRLPEELRAQFAPGAAVTLTITEEEGRPALSQDELVRCIAQSQRRYRDRGTSVEQAAARIRALRDEWEA
jgi:hypothetical protein